MVSWPRPCTYRAFILPNCLLDHDRAHSFRSLRSYFAGSAVELLQGFTLHLQLHLRVLLEDLRVALAQHLCHPLIRYSSSTQPRSISGSKVVDAEIGDLCSPKRLAPNRFESGLVPAPIPITRKEKRTLLCDRHLTPKGFKRQWSQWNFGNAVRSLRVWNPDDRV